MSDTSKHLTGKLHELSFFVQASTTTNVNGIEPDLIMAWLLHKADLCGRGDAVNRNRFLTSARAIAEVYSYLPMAERVRKTT